MSESEEIIRRYERRKNIPENRYSPLNAATYMSEQEKERVLIKLIKKTKLEPLDDKKLLEIGCGTGSNLLHFIRFGFQPSNLHANDILEERLDVAKKRLPIQVSFYKGDILNQNFGDNCFDIVFQSMVFSSILDDDFRKRLAAKMWRWTKPGGGILWYDFIYNNPQNEDVRGIRLKEAKLLFPQGEFLTYKLTLAPPISRFVVKFHQSFYSILNYLRVFNTHIMCYIKKHE